MSLPENLPIANDEPKKNRDIKPSTFLRPPDPSFFDYSRGPFRLRENGLKLRTNIGKKTVLDGSLAGSSKWNIGSDTTSTLDKDTDVGFSTRLDHNDTNTTFEVRTGISHNLMRFIDDRSTTHEKRAILLNMGIDIPEEQLVEKGQIRSLAVGYILANTWVLETADPAQISVLSNSLGLTIDGGNVTIHDRNLIEQWGFASSLGPSYNLTENSVDFGFGKHTIHHLSQTSWGGTTEQLASIKLHELILRLTVTTPILQTDTARWDGRLSAGFSTGLGASIGAGVGRTDMNGRGIYLGFGFGSHGPILHYGRNNHLAGEQNKDYSISFLPTIRSSEFHYIPGFNLVDDMGNVYGKMGDIFQFFHRTPDMEKLLKQSIILLSEIGKKKQIILQRDFVETLDTPEKMGKFVAFLEKNYEFILSDACIFESIHFDENIPSPKKQQDAIIPDYQRSQLHVKSIDSAFSLDQALSTITVILPGKKIETDITKKYNIHIRTSLDSTDDMNQGIDILIRYLEKHGSIDKIQGKYINITPDSIQNGDQNTIYNCITSSGKFQELIIPEGVLSSIVQGTTAIIPFTLTPEDQQGYDDFSLYFGFGKELLPIFHIAEDHDPLLFDANQGETGGYRQYDAENGKIVLSRSYYERIASIIKKPKDSLTGWESFTIMSFRSVLSMAHIKNLEYLGNHVKKSLKSHADGLRSLSTEIGGTTLYDIRPIDEGKITNNGYKKCEVYKTVSGELAGTLSYKTENDATNIILDTGESFVIQNVQDEQAKILQTRFPWLSAYVITGVQGIDSRTGKSAYIQPTILNDIQHQ